MADLPARPATPQAMVHRRPDRPDIAPDASSKPSAFIILIVASNAVAGKVQIAASVANGLSCPLFQGDSLHETSAKAASVGAAKASDATGEAAFASGSGANEARYQRMWLSKMTRTGLLFPEESRPAGSGFSGFGGGPSSASSSRRGSSSSEASEWSSSDVGSMASMASSVTPSSAPKYVNRPPIVPQYGSDGRREAHRALMVVTHPELESWHRACIRNAVGEYGIGVIFVPLDASEELPVLKPFDPRTMTSFGSLSGSHAAKKNAVSSWSDEIELQVDTEAKVEGIVEEIVIGVRDIMNT